MNRAFVKEPDGEQIADDEPERIHSDLPNYITESGLQQLREDVRRLEAERVVLQDKQALDAAGQLQRCRRDLRYLQERLRRAIPMDVPTTPPEHVQFGVTVKLLDETGTDFVFTLVGEDETDVEAGRISWASPLAKILMEREIGETVVWPRGGKDVAVEILEICVDPDLADPR